MSLWKLMVEFVTDLVFDGDGGAAGKGMDDQELEPSVGWHFGFYSRPKDGARGVVIKAGGQGNTSILVAFRDKQYELSLEKGECGMQNAFSASVLLNKDGDIIQTSKTGRKIQLNGTDYALPQWDTFLTDFRTFITDLQADLAAGSSGGCTTTAPTFFTTQLVSPGAYKSTKVTNG